MKIRNFIATLATEGTNRRALLRFLVGGTAAAAAGSGVFGARAASAAPANTSGMSIIHCGISVTDLERSVRFYQALGFDVDAANGTGISAPTLLPVDTEVTMRFIRLDG